MPFTDAGMSTRRIDLPAIFQSFGSFSATSLGGSIFAAAAATLPKVVLLLLAAVLGAVWAVWVYYALFHLCYGQAISRSRQLLSDRAVSGLLHGREAGPETSLAKLAWSECETHIAEMAGQLLGPAANTGAWGRDRVYVRALSIAGGTTQVNKNIVAQRVLGLPRG